MGRESHKEPIGSAAEAKAHINGNWSGVKKQIADL